MIVYGEFTASSSGSSCSVLLTVQRISGSNAGNLLATGTDPALILSVVDLGADPGNSGLALVGGDDRCQPSPS